MSETVSLPIHNLEVAGFSLAAVLDKSRQELQGFTLTYAGDSSCTLPVAGSDSSKFTVDATHVVLRESVSIPIIDQFLDLELFLSSGTPKLRWRPADCEPVPVTTCETAGLFDVILERATATAVDDRPVVIPLFPGHAEFCVTASAIQVQFSQVEGKAQVSLLVPEPATATLWFDLFHRQSESLDIAVPLGRSDNSPGTSPSRFLLSVPILPKKKDYPRELLIRELSDRNLTRLPLDFSAANWADKGTGDSFSLKLLRHRGQIFSCGEFSIDYEPMTLCSDAIGWQLSQNPGTAGWTLVLSNLLLSLSPFATEPQESMTMEGVKLKLTHELVLADAYVACQLPETESKAKPEFKYLVCNKNAPFSLRIPQGTNAVLCIDPTMPSFSLLPPFPGQSGATLFIPGGTKESLEAEPDPNKPDPDKPDRDNAKSSGCKGPNSRNRFLFDLLEDSSDAAADTGTGKPKPVLTLKPSGLSLRARTRGSITPDFSGQVCNIQIQEGEVAMLDGRYTVSIKATAEIPVFENTRGELTVQGGNITPSAPSLSVRFAPRVEGTWEHPSGVIGIENPSAWVEIDWKDNHWGLSSGLGGTVWLRPAELYGDGAADWLSEVFGALRFQFSDLSLAKLAKESADQKEREKEQTQSQEGTRKTAVPAIALSLQTSKPLTIKLFQVLELQLNDFKLGFDAFSFGGKLSVQGLEGGASFAGRLPRIVVKKSSSSVKKRGWVELAADLPLEFEGTLTLPGGIQGELSFAYENRPELRAVSGSGGLSIPGLPQLRASARIGRAVMGKEGKVEPLFFLYLDAEYPVPLFPGIVLRTLGLGLGYNQILRGTGELAAAGGLEVAKGNAVQAELKRFLDHESGLPAPSHPVDWVLPQPGQPSVELVASSYIAPVPTGDGPFPYVGEMVLCFFPFDGGPILLFANLWILTSLSDAKKEDFRHAPLGKGAIILYPRFGRLEGRFQSGRKPKFSKPVPFLSEILDQVTAEVSIEASPDHFRYQLGPLRFGPKKEQLLGRSISEDGTAGADKQSSDVAHATLTLGAEFTYAVAVRKQQAAVASHSSFFADLDLRLGFQSAVATLQIALRAHVAAEMNWLGTYNAGVLLLFGQCQFLLAAELSIDATLEMPLLITTVSIDIHVALAICASLSVEAALTTQDTQGQGIYGLRGRGAFNVSFMGVELNIQMAKEFGNAALIEKARTEQQSFLAP